MKPAAPRSEMRAIVHSIHSQVPETVSRLGFSPRLIVSMDSHLDVSLGGDESVYPRELRPLVARTAAHSALRGIAGGLSALGARPRRSSPGLVVVIPEAMLARHASDVESRLPPDLRLGGGSEESVSSAVGFLAKEMGIEVYASPPRSLAGLLPRTRGRRWVLDIDVDCMQELQGEVYTRIIGPPPGTLLSAGEVLAFVRKARPEAITLSEAKVKAIRDPKSRFSRFVAALGSCGYRVEEAGIYGSDSEVAGGVAVCREFYRKVSSRLIRDHMDEMLRGYTAGFLKAEASEARRFFTERGYGRRDRGEGGSRPST